MMGHVIEDNPLRPLKLFNNTETLLFMPFMSSWDQQSIVDVTGNTFSKLVLILFT
jgi:hypothetical protein